MNPRRLLMTTAVLLILSGAGLLLWPESMWAGLGSPAASLLIAQFLGGFLLAWALLNWLGHRMQNDRLRSLLMANLVLYLLGFAVMLLYYLSGRGHETAWLISGICLLLVVAFGYAYCCLEAWNRFIA